MIEKLASILIVEDDISSQQYYAVILEEDYDFHMVPSAAAAKTALKDKKFDLAIVDLSLSGNEDGLSLIKYMRSHLGLDMPILAISAHAFPINREATLEAGASEYYSKPILSGDLLKAVNRHSPEV